MIFAGTGNGPRFYFTLVNQEPFDLIVFDLKAFDLVMSYFMIDKDHYMD